MANCEKCKIFIHDTLLHPLPHTHPLKHRININAVKKCMPDLINELFLLIQLAKVSILQGEHQYISTLLIENGLIKKGHELGSYSRLYEKTIEWLEYTYTFIRNNIYEIHNEHSFIHIKRESKNQVSLLSTIATIQVVVKEVEYSFDYIFSRDPDFDFNEIFTLYY